MGGGGDLTGEWGEEGILQVSGGGDLTGEWGEEGILQVSGGRRASYM